MYEWAGCCQKANCADVVCLEFCVMDQLAGNAACVGQTLHDTNTLVRLPTDVYKYNTHTLALASVSMELETRRLFCVHSP